jgi:acyl-CoA synthetase (NDP forming)
MTSPDAVRAMLGARSVAVVGASARPGSFGERLVTEVLRSPSAPEVTLVNPRYDVVAGRPCVPSLRDLAEPVDLVLLAVNDSVVEEQLSLAAERGDRSAVVFGSVWSPPAPGPSLRQRLTAVAEGAGMALCGGGCMGFVQVAGGLRALGYLERADLPAGPVALVSHSGSAFSALLRTRRRIGWASAVSSGQELVTTTADYVEHALDQPGTRVVALVLETLRTTDRLRAALDRAAAEDVPVVLLAVGGTPAASALVTAHSGALAGPDAVWEALTDAHGLLRVADLDEMVDLLELLSAGRRAVGHGPGTGLATVHDSGAERVLVADIAHRAGVPFAPLSAATTSRLESLLDPGLEVGNPLDVWGTGADTRELFAGALRALADDPAVAAVALAVDLVEEFDGDDSYPMAVLDALGGTEKPVVVLANVVSAVDQTWAARLRDAGAPVLEGTGSGLRALGHLLALAGPGLPPVSAVVDTQRRDGWLARSAPARWTRWSPSRCCVTTASPRSRCGPRARCRGRGRSRPGRLPGGPQDRRAGGAQVRRRRRGARPAGRGAVASAYEEMCDRLGPRVVLCSTAEPGVELSWG